MDRLKEAREHMFNAANVDPMVANRWIRTIGHIRQAIAHLTTYMEQRDQVKRDAAAHPNPLAEVRQMAAELVRGLARLAERSGTSVSDHWGPDEPQPGQTVPKYDTSPGLERQAISRVHRERREPVIVEMDPPTLFPMVAASAALWDRLVKGETLHTNQFPGDYSFSDPIVLVRGPHQQGRVAFCHVEDGTIRAYTVNVSRF